MGSFGEGDHGKSDNPGLSWVQRGIDQYNAATHRRAMAAPFRLKLLAFLGARGPYIRWQEREPLQPYYPPLYPSESIPEGMGISPDGKYHQT
jgi:hypothetical protein